MTKRERYREIDQEQKFCSLILKYPVKVDVSIIISSKPSFVTLRLTVRMHCNTDLFFLRTS